VWDHDYRHVLRLARSNKGALNCVNAVVTDPIGPAVGANQMGYLGEEYLRGSGSVRRVRWSPRTLGYDVRAHTAATIIVNQRYDRSWRVVAGDGQVVDERGLLAVRVPAGDQRVVLSYRSRPFVIGTVISVIALVLSGLLLVYRV
jgi:uncharacterized membrane protein YfhO